MSDKPKPFIHRPRREHVTREPDTGGRWDAAFPDMIGHRQQGGGRVPDDYGWGTNPKQWQEELTEADLAAAHAQRRVLPAAPLPAPALPEGAKPK